ncbi:hypothetical protein [Tahibacter amnicola]|uniref:Lipoprotein n=1 Tax=Tahibacter amnicola TaxID=2976241 RepID=A0ABY6BIF0_9GAMM|nr:hypothetical protein [Tahibacter amnicola]UXI69788.1 hypothetical protein N4264_09205 [Tahibacter amnicola]
MNRRLRRGIGVLALLLLTGCAPELPKDLTPLFQLASQRERLAGADVAAMTNHVVLTIDRNGIYHNCPLYSKSLDAACRAQMEALVSDGAPPWNGNTVDASSLPDLHASLQRTGWHCADVQQRPLPLRIAADGAWMDCDAPGILPATVSVRITWDTAIPDLIRVNQSGESRDVPLRLIPMTSEPHDEQLLVTAQDRSLHRITLAFRTSSPQHALPADLPELDAASSARVVAVAARHRDAFLAANPPGHGIALLQTAERAGDYFSRLPAPLLAKGRAALKPSDDLLVQATELFGGCRMNHPELTQTCLVGRLMNTPALRHWLHAAVLDARQRSAGLPPEHVAVRHLNVVEEAIRQAGQSTGE